MGLTEQEVLDINSGWRETTANAMRAVAKGGGWVWQMFSGVGGPSGTGDTCAKSLREQCKTQNNRMSMMGLSLKDSHTPGSLKDPKWTIQRPGNPTTSLTPACNTRTSLTQNAIPRFLS